MHNHVIVAIKASQNRLPQLSIENLPLSWILTAVVFLLAKPYIKIKRRPSALCGSSICIVRGKTANLSFTVETVPRAVYEWYNGSRRMNETVFSSRAESNRIRIRGSEFVIRNASSIDNGDYALKISTSGSTLFERINLRVRGNKFSSGLSQGFSNTFGRKNKK